MPDNSITPSERPTSSRASRRAPSAAKSTVATSGRSCRTATSVATASESPSFSGGEPPARASRTADVAETLLMVALMAAALFLAAV